MSNFFGRQTADLAQRERDLCVGRERRVAAREDEAQLVIFDAFFIRPRRGINDSGVSGIADFVKRIKPLAPAHAVDRFEASSGRQPCARIGGTPSRGHCSSAALNASCNASSAASKSPSTRISVASTRRESER